MFNMNFADDWSQTSDLWYQKRPLYQLSHNHFQMLCYVRANQSLFQLVFNYFNNNVVIIGDILGRGQWIGVLALNSDDPSLNPAVEYNSSVFEKNGKNQKRLPGLAYFLKNLRHQAFQLRENVIALTFRKVENSKSRDHESV